MAIVKEWRCAAHGPFEGPTPKCPKSKLCPTSFIKREFRTAPAFQRKGTRVVDQSLRDIAKDFGLSDMKNDPKSGTSVMQELRKGIKTGQSTWSTDVQHAKAGFSQREGEKAPVFKPESAGFAPTPGAQAAMKNMPKPRPQIVGRYDGS